MAGIGNFDVTAVLKANVSDFQRGMAQAQASFKSFQSATGSTMQNVGSTVAGIGKGLTLGVTVPLLAVGAASVKTAMSFEKQMNRVKAISGATGNDFDKLRDQAIKLGADSVFSATEVAQAQEMMASAGFDTNEIYSSMAGVMDLAAVSGGDMALASEAVATAMNQFGLEGSEAGHVADIFARAAADTNAETTDMAEALKYAGPIAGSLGVSMEETAAAIGIMADAGIKGSQSGTTLRSAFTRLANPTKKASDLMAELGFSAFDANGEMKPLDSIIGDLQNSFKGMTDEQKQQAIATLFGQEAMSGMLALVNGSPEQFSKLVKSLENSDGAAQDMADTMNSGLAGAVESLKGALESAGIAIGTALTPFIQDLAEWITKLVDKFNSLSTEQQEQVAKWGAIASAVGPVLWVLGSIIGTISKMNGVFGGLKGLLAPIGKLLFGTAESAGLLSQAFGILTGPVGLIIGILVALGIALYDLYQTNEYFRNMVNDAWTEVTTVISGAVESVKTFIGSLIDKFKEFITNNDDLLESTQGVWEGIKTAVMEVVEAIAPIIAFVWDAIVTHTVVAWNLVKGAISIALELILGIIETVMHLLNGDWEAAWNTIKETAVNIWNIIVSSATGIFQILSRFFSNLWTSISNVTSNTWNNIQQSLANTWNNIKSIISSSMNNVSTNISTGWSNAKQSVSNAMSNILNSIRNGWNNAVSAVTSAGQRIVSTVSSAFSNAISSASSFASQAVSVGSNLIMGFVNGVRAKASALVDSVKGAVSGAINAAKSLLGIHSPSRVFKQFGVYTDQGFAIGIDKEAKAPLNAMRNMIDSIVSQGENGLNSGFNGLQGQLNGMVNSAVTTDVRSTLDYSNKPAYINLSMGGQTYRAYVEDISNEQGAITELDMQF